MKKHSIRLFGHATSFSLEEPFFKEVKALAKEQGLSLQKLIEQIDERRGYYPLSEALRLFVLEAFQKKISKLESKMGH
ncbi:MAG: aryl-sulfate sulfotransferase [Alphaproteobacteria bacterium]|nr:ribbon-helix-helix domain-containing protein [Alphaproteobacteria bacterium]NCB49843.1 aryl-sulfate sulfotransferase [Alphaproteobacteria bacterium]